MRKAFNLTERDIFNKSSGNNRVINILRDIIRYGIYDVRTR